MIFGKNAAIVEAYKICISWGLGKLAPLSTRDNAFKEKEKGKQREIPRSLLPLPSCPLSLF